MSSKIDNDVREILEQATITDDKLVLPDIKLDRALYVKVNEHLANCGGKWNRKEKAHIFSKGTERLKKGIERGETISEKKEYHAFYTPSEIARRLIIEAELKSSDRVLEPSAGCGNLIDEILIYTNNIDAVELNSDAVEELQEKYKDNVHIYNDDFLKWETDKSYNYVIMNPPFNRNEWVKHIVKALSLLDNKGEVYAVTPTSYYTAYFKKHIEQAGIEYAILHKYKDDFEGTKISVYITRFKNV